MRGVGPPVTDDHFGHDGHDPHKVPRTLGHWDVEVVEAHSASRTDPTPGQMDTKGDRSMPPAHDIWKPDQRNDARQRVHKEVRDVKLKHVQAHALGDAAEASGVEDERREERYADPPRRAGDYSIEVGKLEAGASGNDEGVEVIACETHVDKQSVLLRLRVHAASVRC